MCWSQSWMCFIRVILVILAHFVSPQEFSKKHGDTEYSALLCFVCWNARQSSLSVSVTNSSQDLEDINTVLIWRKKNTRPCFPPVENNRKCLILLLGNSRKMMWWMCMTLYRASNLMIFFFFSFFFSPSVQEDAEPGAKPPVWDESLRQSSVRVHLQHLPWWALQDIFRHK